MKTLFLMLTAMLPLRATAKAGRYRLVACLAAPCIVSAAVAAAASSMTSGQSFNDPLLTPASTSSLAERTQLTGIAAAGKRLVAVGRRGTILMSTDEGKSWSQIPSPVSADFTAIRFSDDEHGWIVGHDAVVLKTSNGGMTWERKLDGRDVLKLVSETYDALARTGDASMAAIAEDARRAAAQSATPGVLPYPFLDVWFSNSREGFVAGAFGLLLHTTDGGETWKPWIERTDNDRMNHIYAISGTPENLYLAGEQGMLRRWDGTKNRFVKVDGPYEGSYFGMYARKDLLVVHGLRGNAYVSRDGGSQWQKVSTGVTANIVAALPGAGQDLLLVSQAGHVLVAADGATTVKDLKAQRTGEIYGAVAAGPRTIVTTGFNGVHTLAVPSF